jgi:hypothetical protein
MISFFFGFSFFVNRDNSKISISYPSCIAHYGWEGKLNGMEGLERKEEEKDRLLLFTSLAFKERRKRVGYEAKEGRIIKIR